MAVKLITLNVEKDTHLERQKEFFAREDADILCLHELFYGDYQRLTANDGVEGVFAPMCHTERADGSDDVLGSAIITSLPLADTTAHVYRNDASPLATYVWRETPQSVLKRTLLTASLEMPGGADLRLATTHFTWSANAAVTPEQSLDVSRVLGLLEKEERVVFCGDMNAPRGGEIFGKLAASYKDCVPSSHTTSLDADLHYAGDLQLMVDGLFTSPHYEARDVRLIGGVSDHLAIIATLDNA